MKARPVFQNFSALGVGCLLLSAPSGTAFADFEGDSTPQSGDTPLHPMSVVSTSGNVTHSIEIGL
jgi:hypothetical protein